MEEASRTPAALEDDRLTAEWIEACREGSVLQSDLHNPTASRSYEAQAKLVLELKAAGDKCNSLFLALRAHRKATLKRPE